MPGTRESIRKAAKITVSKVLNGCQSREKEYKDPVPIARVVSAPEPPFQEVKKEPVMLDADLDPKYWKLDQEGNMVYIPDIEEKGGSVVRL